MDGEPNSVAPVGAIAIGAVDTSESFAEPSGYVASFSDVGQTETDRCDPGGQPDSVAVAPDGSFVAVAVENVRDEEVNGGAILQLPAGFLVTIGLTAEGLLDCDTLRRVELTGLGAVLAHFSAGTMNLSGIDTAEDGAAVPQEPDGMRWIDDDRFATANEGDLDGGSRSWTI